jgi:hypothetical protein
MGIYFLISSRFVKKKITEITTTDGWYMVIIDASHSNAINIFQSLLKMDISASKPD